MSTSQQGSDAAAQATANLRIEELERQLFLANSNVNHMKQDHARDLERAKKDLERSEQELKKLVTEDHERRDLASYEIEKASRKSEALEKELAALRGQPTTEAIAKPKEESTSKDPKAPKGSAPTYEELKANFIKLKKVTMQLDRAYSKLQGEKADQDENVRRLKSQLKTYEGILSAVKTVAERGDSDFEGVDPLLERLKNVEEDCQISLDTDIANLDSLASQFQSTVASLKKTKDVGGWKIVRETTYETHRSLSVQESRLIKELHRVPQPSEAENASVDSSETSKTAPAPETLAQKTAQDNQVTAKKGKAPSVKKTLTANQKVAEPQPSDSKEPKQEERLSTQNISAGEQTEGKQPQASSSLQQDSAEAGRALKSPVKGGHREEAEVQPEVKDVKSTPSGEKAQPQEPFSWANDVEEAAMKAPTNYGTPGASGFGQFQISDPSGFTTGGHSAQPEPEYTVVPSSGSQKTQVLDWRNPNDSFPTNNTFASIAPGKMRPTSRYATTELGDYRDEGAMSTTSSQPANHPAYTSKSWRKKEAPKPSTERPSLPSSAASKTVSAPETTPPTHTKSPYAHPSKGQKLKAPKLEQPRLSESAVNDRSNPISPTAVAGDDEGWRPFGASSSAETPVDAASASAPPNAQVIQAERPDQKAQGVNMVDDVFSLDNDFQPRSTEPPHSKPPQSKVSRNKLDSRKSGGLVAPAAVPYHAQPAGHKGRPDVPFAPPLTATPVLSVHADGSVTSGSIPRPATVEETTSN